MYGPVTTLGSIPKTSFFHNKQKGQPMKRQPMKRKESKTTKVYKNKETKNNI